MKKINPALFRLNFLFVIVLIAGASAFAPRPAHAALNFRAPAKTLAAAAAARFKASEFELKDQYNRSFAVRFPREKPLVLVFGDRKGSSQIEGWVRPLYNRYGGNIDIYGVAELSAVPSLLQGMVRQIFKSQVKFSVMLDWSGRVSKSYGYQPGKANVFVISKDGDVVFRQTGDATESALSRIYGAIN